MAKREAPANVLTDGDTPSAKRRKDVAAVAPAADDAEAQDHDAGANSDQEQDAIGRMAEGGPAMSPDEIREEGSKVLQVLKEATNKEGRLISHDFWRLPSKRQFPDYYEIIKRPIALDDIKVNLESFAYTSLDSLRQDLEQCFKNAKKYNMRESVIWKDAKSLQKLASKEVDRIHRKYTDDDDEGDGSDRESGKKKEKGVNIHRLMKNRLQKLIGYTDENEVLISASFMELPSRKKWPVYYKIIKRPICVEDVFKRIKRKEYPTITDYMNDVNLIFNNATTFNEEGSEIWTHASILRNYFHQLMSDLPSKYNMNGTGEGASADGAPNKIKLKIPGHQAVSHAESSTDSGQVGDSGAGTIRLRVPALGGEATIAVNDAQPVAPNATQPVKPNGLDAAPARKTKVKSPAVTATQLPSTPSTSLPAPTPRPAKAIPAYLRSAVAEQQQTPVASSAPLAPIPPYPYTPNAQIPSTSFYTSSLPSSSVAIPGATPSRTSATPAPLPSSIAPRTGAPSPKPSVRAAGVYSVRLEVSNGRRLPLLDQNAGVRNWAVRLAPDERRVTVKDVRFERTVDGDGDGSDDEHEKNASGVVPTPKKRGRGRPRKNPSVEKAPESPIKETPEVTLEKKMDLQKSNIIFPPAENVVVRLDGVAIVSKATRSKPESVAETLDINMNGTTMADAPDTDTFEGDEWSIELTSGRHVLEVGRRGNNVLWQVYVYA